MTFRARPVQAYFIQPYEALPAGFPKHSFGTAEEARETCPHCDQPLSTLLSLDPADPRLELPALGGAPLKLCVCSRCQPLQYTLVGDGEIIAIHGPSASSSLFAAELLAPEFCPVALHAIPDRIAEARTLAAEGRLDEAGIWASDYDWRTPTNQVGGRPANARNMLPSPACPLCGTPLPFLASIVCATAGPADVEGLDQVQILFFVCRDCPTVVAITHDSEKVA